MRHNLCRRVACVLLAVSLLLSFCALCAGAEDAPSDTDKPVFLLMGDSIPDAYGIDNRDEASYGRIVADTNGYVYRNIGRTATDSAELVDLIENYALWDKERNGWRNVTDYIAEADIICLSIGANDYFDQDDETVKLLVGALFGVNKKEMDAIAAQYYTNLCRIIELIRENNPDTEILVQTLYSVWYGLAGNANRACAKRVNGMIEKYDREHPDTIHICDISPAMNRKPQNLADDCAHPNANGNVAIAEVVLQKLYDLGLGTETTPVVHVAGTDWNYFTTYYGESKGKFLAAVVMIATGNGVNVFRLFKE